MPTPDRTSLAAIVDAANTLLDEGGERAITMQAVASRVGVRAPSLYKRVRDRDALLELVAARVAAELTVRLAADGGDIGEIARTFRSFSRERPEAFRLLFAGAAAAEAFAPASEPLLGATRALVGEGHALDAARFVTAWVTGFVNLELAGAFRLGGDVDAAFAYGIDRLVASLSPGQVSPGQVLPVQGS